MFIAKSYSPIIIAVAAWVVGFIEQKFKVPANSISVTLRHCLKIFGTFIWPFQIMNSSPAISNYHCRTDTRQLNHFAAPPPPPPHTHTHTHRGLGPGNIEKHLWIKRSVKTRISFCIWVFAVCLEKHDPWLSEEGFAKSDQTVKPCHAE